MGSLVIDGALATPAATNYDVVERLLRDHRPGIFKVAGPAFNSRQVPVMIIHGAKRGLRLCVTAGIHGSEYCAIETAQRLAQIDPASLKGTLIILPVVNTPAFHKRSVYVNPTDDKNLNRIFPGDLEGSASDRLVYWLLQDVVRHADAWVDLHCGDLSEIVTPFTLYCDGDKRSEQLARDFGLPYGIAWSGSGMSIAGASTVGVPAIIAEAGGAGTVDAGAIETLLKGLHRLLERLGMRTTVDEVELSGSQLKVVRGHSITASSSGLWYPTCSAGRWLMKGDPVGSIKDLYGDELCRVTAPDTGVVLFHVVSLVVNEGETIAWIGS